MGLDTVLIFKDGKLTNCKERKARIMKGKRIVSIFAVLLLCVCLITPISTDAAARVRVRTVKGVTSSYSGRMNYCYVNGKKIKLTKNPIFKKSGSYMGPVAAIFKNSGLKVKVTTKRNKMTLSYGPNTVVLKADSRKAVTNGVKSQMGAPVVHGTYTSTGRRRWIVPLKSVCTRLGINYKLSGGKIRISGTTKSSASNTTAPTTEDRRTETTDSKEKIKIVIDAGHGGSDPGKVGNSNILEKDINLSLALKLQKLLEKKNYKVYMTRNGDYNLADSKENEKRSDLSNRKQLIFENDPMAVISIHQNSYPSSDVHGAQVFYPQGSEKSKQLADHIQSALIKGLDPNNHREAKANAEYYLFRDNPYPIVIVECGFLSNPEELRSLQDNNYQKKAVQCILDGIESYLADI